MSEARAAVIIGVPAIASFLLFVFAAHGLGLLRFDLAIVVPFVVGLILFNLLAAATAPRWAEWSGAVYAWEAFYAVMLALMFHLDLRSSGAPAFKLAILLNAYLVLVIHTQTFRAEASPLVTATMCAATYVALGAVRWSTGVSSGEELAYALAGSLALLFVALYVRVNGLRLRYLAGHFQQLVDARTEALTAANRGLEKRQAELRELVYAVTHDLKNPINAIHLIADLMQQRGVPSRAPADDEDVARIMHLAAGTEDMIRDLLGMFRITSADEPATWVDLDALVARVLGELGPQIAAKGVQVDAGALPRVFGQREKLQHVVRNLLSNAVKYVASGAGRITIAGEPVDCGVQIAVRDNGIGIAPEYHRGIFELFGRVPEEEQRVDGQPVAGSGVGLAIVQRVVEAHGGWVGVESAPGRGSTFRVRLPRTDLR